jgi:predicted RNA-binding protein with PIN domain
VLHAHLLKGRDRRNWRSAQRRQLVLDQAARLCARGERVCVVFDGHTPAGEPQTAPDAPLRAVFAPHADAWILDQLDAVPEPDAIAVVSADRELREGALRRGARVVSPRAWLERCAAAEAEAPDAAPVSR